VDLGLPWWIGSGDPLEGVEAAASAGYDFVEVSLDAPWPDELDPIELRQASKDAGVDLGFHMPWRDQSLAHPREPLARAAREVAQDCVDLARAAGGLYAVFHVDARAFSRFPRPDTVTRGLEQAHASLRALSRSAGEDLSILVENTSSPLGTPGELTEFLDPLPDVGFCLDPGHAAIVDQEGVEGSEAEPRAWAIALGDRLELLHAMDLVVDEHGVSDHLIPGAGEADLAEMLDAARAGGCDRVLVEAFYADRERTEATIDDFEGAAKRLRDL
jgi:sugar phosphate isomerase/epimerase